MESALEVSCHQQDSGRTAPNTRLAKIRANSNFIFTASVTNLIFLVNLNIPLWTAGSVFGLQAAGWFATARRVVATPAQFALNTLSVAFNQRTRAKHARRKPILRDMMLLIGVLLGALAPVFIALGWLARSSHLGLLGADWAGAGPTLAVIHRLRIDLLHRGRRPAAAVPSQRVPAGL